MLDLLLMRHAKSSWHEPDSPDRERPLSSRGRSAAQAMGHKIAGQSLQPELVLCSPARRTQETWEIVKTQLGLAPPVRMVEAIYDFGSGAELVDLLHNSTELPRRLMLVGHNPSLQGLAARLIGQGDATLRDQLALKFPTGALAVIHFDVAHWTRVAAASGRLGHFIRPRDLAGGC